tara:strand:- start:414 stop:2477 length:2064 start_codon:yes stop_codon:yes gene_type:complete
MSTWTEAQKELAYDKYENGIDVLTDDYKAKWKIAHKINEEGKFTEALDLVENSEYKKGRFGFIQAKAKKAITDIETNFTKSAGDISGLNADEVRQKLETFQSEYWKDFKKYPESLQLKLKQNFSRFEASKLSEVNKKDNEALLQRYENERLFELETNLEADDLATFEKNSLKMIDLLMVEKNISFTEAIEYLQEDILKLVESNVIPESLARKFEAVTILHRGKKGHPREEILKSHAKTFSKTDWDNRLTKASANATAIRDQNKFNYQKQVEQNIQDIEDEQGFSMTNTQLAEYLKQNYDPSKGGPIPDALTNRLTKEKADDKELVRQLEHKWDKGIPFSKEEVMKLNDRDLENQWLQKVTETNPNVPSTEYTEDAHSLIDKYINGYTKESDGNKDKTTKWQNNQINSKRAYAKIYAQEIQTAPSEYAAHKNALDRVKANIEAGIYNELPNSDPNAAVNREVALIAASEAVALNENIVNTGIIYGTEEIIKEAALLPEGEVHLFYKQLADKNKINAHKLQYRQLEIAAELKGEGKPVKSKILQEFEKLDATTQELLSRHPSPAKVTRAIVEEYGKDGVIDYNDVGLLIDDVLEDYPVTETVIEGSPQSQMKQSPRVKKRPDDEVAFFDDPKVRQNIQTGANIAFQTLLPKYYDGQKLLRTLSRDLAKAISDRKKEVEELNRVDRRKRY